MKKRLENPMLLVIDMQNVYGKGQAWECKRFEEADRNIRILLDHVTREEVLFTKYTAAVQPVGVWKDYNRENAAVNADPWLNDMVSDLKPYTDQYPVYEKSTYSSLENALIREKVKEKSCVIVTGVVAECCVLSTVMSLIDMGIYVIYLKDAVAGIDDTTEEAAIKVLEGLSPLHLKIMTTEDYRKVKEGNEDE